MVSECGHIERTEKNEQEGKLRVKLKRYFAFMIGQYREGKYRKVRVAVSN